MNKEKIPAEIFDLLESKCYEDLTDKEKGLVAVFLTAEEYLDLKNTISDFQEIDGEINIEQKTFLFPYEKPTLLSKILNYPIPAYQVAATLLVLFGLFAITNSGPGNQNSVSVNGPEIDTTGISVANDVYPDSLIFKL